MNRNFKIVNLKIVNARLVLQFLEMELRVADITPTNRADAYSANAYHVTDKATQPDVIGYAIAAATEALNVSYCCLFQ